MPLPECTRIYYDDADSAARLVEAGWREVEVLETWEGYAPQGISLMPREYYDPEELQHLARLAYSEDRLHKDPTVPKGEADAAKAKWIMDAVKDRRRSVLVHGEPVQAFLSCFVGKLLTVDLLAVHPAHRGKGIAKRLLITACFVYKARMLRAGTQSTNEPAKRLYASLGMTVVKRERTFHR